MHMTPYPNLFCDTIPDCWQVFYDGFEQHGWDGGNYMIDPEFWGLIAKRGKAKGLEGNLWRVTYGDTATGLSDEEYEHRTSLAS
jgi:hypothetical protein